jgi:hypothetical protein
MPSHEPVVPQVSRACTVHTPCGSGLFVSMGQQLPSRPGWLQVTHAPLHATLQHNPSAQNPDAHSLSLLHTAPRGLGPQLPATHWTPLTQFAEDAQVEMHLLVAGSQPNGAQMVAGPGRQRPWPSQTLTSLTESPWHLPGLQTVPATYLRQWPAPSQLPSRPQVDTSELAQVDGVRGGSPAGTNVHTPGALATLQALHVSLHSLLQHTPSTQKPLTQSAAHMQA